MDDNSISEFNFDDWAELYKKNPEEFEARRSAALMLELASGTSQQRAAAFAVLESFESRAKACDPQQRMELAASMMTESLSELSTELMVLKKAVEDFENHAKKPRGKLKLVKPVA